MQQAGLRVPGFAAQLYGDRWPEITAWFLLTEQMSRAKDAGRGCVEFQRPERSVEYLDHATLRGGDRFSCRST